MSARPSALLLLIQTCPPCSALLLLQTAWAKRVAVRLRAADVPRAYSTLPFPLLPFLCAARLRWICARFLPAAQHAGAPAVALVIASGALPPRFRPALTPIR